jgi:hypothetical protein
MQIEVDYLPQSHQKQLHDCNTSLVAVTGRQIGKTIAAVNELIKRAVITKGSRNWYVTNDYRQAKRNVWDLLLKFLPKELVKEANKSDLTVTLVNGSRIELIGVENAEKLRGAAVHFMILDEYADFKDGIFEKVLEPMLTTTNGQMWFLGTPKGLGNDFYFKYIEDNKFRKFKFPSCIISGGKVMQVLSVYTSIEKMQEIYNRAVEEGKLDYFNQEHLAEFTRPSGTVYKEWSIDNYKKFDYDENLPVHLTFDFGVNDPTAIIWIQPKGGETRVIDYYEATNADINHFIQVLRAKPYKTPEFCTGDIAGRATDLTSGKSPISMLKDAGYYIKTSHIPNILAQVRQAHTKIKHLYINHKSSRFKDIILNYRYPEVKTDIRNQSNEIPLHDQWSHGARAFEYYCWNYSPPDQEMTGIKKVNTGQEILDRIEENRKARDYLSWM